MAESAERPVRALHTAVRVPGFTAPCDTAHLKVHYPVSEDPTAAVGAPLLPAADLAPFPVVVLFPGMNVDAARYSWLAVKIARAGFAVVTFTLIGTVPPGQIGITPGADYEVVRPGVFGTASTSLALGPILAAVAEFDSTGPLAGLLDLGRVALGGHSAGGNVALQAADHRFFPTVRAAFSYGAHTMAAMLFGWPPSTVLPLTGDCPVLLVTGTEAGQRGTSAPWYGETPETHGDPVARTFDTLPANEAATGSWYLRLQGGNHFTVAHPRDETWDRAALDEPAIGDEDALRDLYGRAVTLFLCDTVRGEADARAELEALVRHPLVVAAQRR